MHSLVLMGRVIAYCSVVVRRLIPPPARGRSTAFASLAKQMLSGGGGLFDARPQ